MLRAISQIFSRIHRTRVQPDAHAIGVITVFGTPWRERSLIITGEGRSRSRRVSRVSRGERRRTCALNASSCVLLRLFGSARVSPHHGRAAACDLWGVTTTESACAVHSRFSLFSLRPPPRPRATPRAARIDVGLARVERHRARRPQLSWQFVLNARGTTFSAEGWMHRCTAGTVADFRRESSATQIVTLLTVGGIKLVSVHRFAMRSLGTSGDVFFVRLFSDPEKTRVKKGIEKSAYPNV